MDSTTRDVAMPTFVNPHLFWIIESNSSERIKTLNYINNLMQNECTNRVGLNYSFEIGEIVAVSAENKFCRAIIEDIPINDFNKKASFLCWLIDYGMMYETDVVYKLPSDLRKVTPLALQASLNNVAYVQQSLAFDEISGLPVKTNVPSLTPTSTAHQVSLELISDLSDLKFVVENKVDGIVLGDILYKTKQELKSLRQTLIDRGILTIDEILFKEIQENIFSYKEEHLWLIAQVCKKLNSVNFLDTLNRSSCDNIIFKYLAEFEDSELFQGDELMCSHKRRSRSRNTVNDSQNSINSENDSTSDIDKLESSSGSKKSPGSNRLKLLLEEMKRQKNKTEKPKDISENNHITDSNISVNNNIKEQLLGATATSCDNENRISVYKDVPTNLDLHTENEESKTTAEKILFPRNTIFVPGGASFSLIKKPKTNKSQDFECKISTEEELSDSNPKATHTFIRDENTNDDISTEESKVDSDVGKIQVNNQLQIKPFCTCKQCQHWTTDKDWQTDTQYLNDSKQLKHLTPIKPQSFFVSEDENMVSTRKIISLNYTTKTKLQKQATPKLLIHGEYSQAPVRKVSDVYLHDVIRNNMRNLKYHEAKRIQMYAWPTILRQQHVVMVNGPKTGKTIGYVPVILTFLLEKHERYEQFTSKSGGPIAVILCSNTRKCEEIYDLIKTFLGQNKLKISNITYPITHVNTKYIDMLITTPTVIIDLLKMKAINFKRLCHLVLEDGDIMLKLESDTIYRVFDLAQSMLCNRVHPKPVQLIICAEHWTLRIENLVHKLSQLPLLCIGNHLEAALYGKMQFSMKFVNSACKEHELKNLLKETFRICKSIIICKKDEIKDIETILMLKGIDATVISEDMNKEDILYMEDIWTQCKGGDFTVLVCTDFILNTLLTVTSASLVIHYSLPSSWTQFVKRFGCLIENCNSPFDTTQSKTKCQSVVLCDENCEDHMSKFFRFIDCTELKTQMPDKIKMFSEDLKKIEEEKKLKNKIALCDSLKMFGTCLIVQCPWRHIIGKHEDIFDDLPQSGKIKFKIVNIYDVTNYSVQLLQHIDIEGNIREFADNPNITEDLTSFVTISRKQVNKPVVGQQYAYYDMDEMKGVYYRCDLLELEGDCIKIMLIDQGNIIKTIKNRLFKLPKEFKSKPRKFIDIYLANLTPPYHDSNFSSKSFYMLKTLLEKHDYENMTLTADIHLQLGNALWLKNVYEEVTLSEKVIPRFQLTREILVLKLAEYNNHHLNKLYKLCKEASVSLPIYEKQIKHVAAEQKKIEPQWAHLDTDISEVTFSAAVSPDEIYVRLNKFNQQLYSLQKEIQESLRKPNYPKLENVEVDTVCLAKDPEGIDYARVIVTNIEENKALCFFVDFGDETVVEISELRYIQNKFITKLPFQSIQCRLHGVKPVLEDWQSDINNILYEYATETDTDVFRLLFLKTCSKEKNEVISKQNRYSVLLKDGFGEKRVLINSLLIDCGVAVPNSEQFDDFKISIHNDNSEETDEELEHIIDICKKTKDVEENMHLNGNRSNNGDLVNEDMELFLINAHEFFKSLLTEKNDDKPVSNRELPAIQAAPPVDYYTPDVYWSQTDQYIKMDIKLHDIDQYNLNLTKGTILHFKTVKKEKTFKLNLMLYQKVNSIQHTSMGLHIRVRLTKSNNVEWPRLTLSKQRARNIHYDVSTITVKEETRKFLELPGISDDDEPDDDNIDIMYHVVSDLDSDMDADIAEDSG